MSPITRSWLALAAVGSGLIHLALVLGVSGALGAALATVGVVQFGWGVLTFARDRVAVPRAALAGALVPILGWAALTLAAPRTAATVGFVPLGIAALLQLGAAVLLARHLRAGAPGPAPTVGRYALGLIVAVVVVGALTATAIAASEVLPSNPPPPGHIPH